MEKEDKVMSAAAANVNIDNDDTIDYFRKRIMSNFDGTVSLSLWYLGIYLIGMIFIMYQSWVRMIIISILVSLVFLFLFSVIADSTWKELLSYLMITSGPRSMKEVSHGVSALIFCSGLFMFPHFVLVCVYLPPEVQDSKEILFGFLYVCAALLIVFPVLQFRTNSKMTKDLIAFERRVQQSSAATYSYCKCTMRPPTASASDEEWISYYLVN